jgi:hypothetical protein
MLGPKQTRQREKTGYGDTEKETAKEVGNWVPS